jgi:hypothetical protein
MARYKVWNPDEEGEADALELHAASPDDAAEIYLSGIGPHFDTYDLCVTDEDGVQYDVCVDVEIYNDPETGDQHPGFTSWAKRV